MSQPQLSCIHSLCIGHTIHPTHTCVRLFCAQVKKASKDDDGTYRAAFEDKVTPPPYPPPYPPPPTLNPRLPPLTPHLPPTYPPLPPSYPPLPPP